MIDPRQALRAGVHYLRRHPEEFLRQVRNGPRLTFGLPVAALQWLVTKLAASSFRGPSDIEITAVPPGIRVKATVEQMGTLIRADCVILVERITLDALQARFELRLKDVALSLLDDSIQTPLAALIRSGTLDVSRLASLVAHMPSRPAILVEAVDDRIVLDLMKIPKLERDDRYRRWIGMLSSLITVSSIASDSEHLDIQMRALPNGLSGAFR